MVWTWIWTCYGCSDSVLTFLDEQAVGWAMLMCSAYHFVDLQHLGRQPFYMYYVFFANGIFSLWIFVCWDLSVAVLERQRSDLDWLLGLTSDSDGFSVSGLREPSYTTMMECDLDSCCQ